MLNHIFLEKDPVGSKVLERNVCVSSSEIKAEKEQPDHENIFLRNAEYFVPKSSKIYVMLLG